MLPRELAGAGFNGCPLQGAVSGNVNDSASRRSAPSGTVLIYSSATGSRLSRYTYRLVAAEPAAS